MKKLFRNISLFWVLIISLLLATTLVWQATRWAYTDALNTLIKVGGERMTLYSGTLHEALSRYAYLPYVLSQNIDIKILLKSSFNADLVNDYLQSLNAEAGSDTLYVMSAVGDTLAASNWQDPQTYIGHNYGFRPYFTDAKSKLKGRFFAIGATTGKPGYFMSHSVCDNGQFLGATIAKVDLTPLQDDWHKGGETVLVSDANGVLFLSSREDWKYRTLTQLSENQRTMILAGRQYGAQALELLPLETVEVLAEGQKIVRFDKALYLFLSRPQEDLGWQLHHVAPLAPVQERSQAVMIIGIVLTLLLLALSLYGRERRQKQISRRKAHQAEAIQAMNLRLQAEIAERNRTESVLHETQKELVQAGKLAALGHMAAGIVHELNQPITAIRTQAASGHLLLDRGETGKVRETFSAITRMTEHMASITAQLKTFAHKIPPKRKERVVLQDCLDGALNMTASMFSDFGISLQTEVPAAPVVLSGDQVRIKQVLVNLIRNAVDAMKNSEKKVLQIKVTALPQDVEIVIIDSGIGIDEHNMGELFTPFFTTKDVGEGLGLGLSISYRIITDLDGSIKGKSLDDGGACFTIKLPRIQK
ncbi:two-component system, NtrC family, C4-dicarboxylate transport sensor histidine kinase DctB [Desulfuromusa kysingii]|uniref:C4-dicarboxylate transport sensor protein DctB n=1 Tax=Desulfuromusa kysingii TaxID=37625 RepID=A0A1H3Y3Z8_9BACT|nr:ATP-binding protein [Desulfuromusa kysingii]SEA06240.1 two-component system, NtrC family, C4-dicarboxylate transport sensor histidine kinase DctB [Desulfuromusa kysingii]